MNSPVKIKINTCSNRFINYLIYNNIYYSSLIKTSDSFILITNYENYKKIARRFETVIIKYYGKMFFVNFIKTNKYMILSIIISLLLLRLLTSTIFEININTEDQELKKEIFSSLNENGIDIYKKKKTFNELNKIKNNILKSNEDILEWIEIVEKGCSYTINLTKRVKKKSDMEANTPSDIVASKDGLIKYITNYSGTKLKDVNDYVKKGDVLITGNIIKNDEVVDKVKAVGKVYAEVWYTVKVNIPYNYIEYTDSLKKVNHYYLDIFGKKFTLLGKYDSKNTINTRKLILNKPYLLFKLYKEEKKIYEYKEYKITKDDAYKEALHRSEKQIKNRLKSDEYIISKNTLKKDAFRSKIYVEVFFKVYENIGVASDIGELDENNGISN